MTDTLSDDEWSIPDSMIDTDEEEEELRDWKMLLGGEEHVDSLRDWLAGRCPAHVALHDCQLDKGVWENTKGKTHEERREKFEARIAADWERVYETCEKQFSDTPLWSAFLAVERREDENHPYDVLEDFWGDNYETWMVVGNEEAREMLKPLKSGMELLAMAEIHRNIAMSSKNMTEMASTILSVNRPDVYAVRRAIDSINESNQCNEDDAMMWNFPAARDVLTHLVRTRIEVNVNDI